jgi:hypothetical protein
MKAFRTEICGFMTNECGSNSHCLHMVGRPDPENAETAFKYTRRHGEDADAVDGAIAIALSISLARGPAKAFLDPKLVSAGKGHEIMGNVVEHFENLGKSSVSTLWSDLTSQTTTEGEHYLTVFQRIESIRDDLESAGQTVEESVMTSAVETAFSGHRLYGNLIEIFLGDGITYEGWRSKFKARREHFKRSSSSNIHTAPAVAALDSGMLENCFAFHADAGQYEERWCEHCWKQGRGEWKSSTHNSEDCRGCTAAKAKAGPK